MARFRPFRCCFINSNFASPNINYIYNFSKLYYVRIFYNFDRIYIHVYNVYPCPYAYDLGCLVTFYNTFSLDFCNIRGLISNFEFMEHYLSSTKPHLLFLTETQLSVTTDSSSFSIPSYIFYPHFQPKAGCCVYLRNDITCFHPHNFESLEFSIIWLRLQCHSLIKCMCAAYLSPNSSDYVKFSDYLTSKVEYILSHFPYAEILIIEISMFTFCFPLLSLTNLVNILSILLSFMT